MSASSSSWSRFEKAQAVSVAVAPAIVVGVSALALSKLWQEDLLLLAVFALPFAYATLFFFVLPALIVLRRYGRESVASFTAAVSAASVVPWASLYLLLRQVSSAANQPPPSLVITGLAVVATVSAVLAATIWLAFGSKNAA